MAEAVFCFGTRVMTGEGHLDKRPVTGDRAKLSESEALVGVEDLRQESFCGELRTASTVLLNFTVSARILGKGRGSIHL